MGKIKLTQRGQATVGFLLALVLLVVISFLTDMGAIDEYLAVTGFISCVGFLGLMPYIDEWLANRHPSWILWFVLFVLSVPAYLVFLGWIIVVWFLPALYEKEN